MSRNNIFKRRSELCIERYKHLVGTKHKKISIVDIYILETEFQNRTVLKCVCDCGIEFELEPSKLICRKSCLNCKFISKYTDIKKHDLYEQINDFFINQKSLHLRNKLPFYKAWQNNKEGFFNYILKLESQLTDIQKKYKFYIVKKDKNKGIVPNNLYLKTIFILRDIPVKTKEVKVNHIKPKTKEVKVNHIKPKTLKEKILSFINEQPKDLPKDRLYNRLTLKFNKSIKEILEIIEK